MSLLEQDASVRLCVVRHDAGTDGGEFGEAIHVFELGRPADAAQHQDAKEWVVEGPRVMAGDATDDAALVALKRPELRTRLVVFDGGGEDRKSRRVTAHRPVGF